MIRFQKKIPVFSSFQWLTAEQFLLFRIMDQVGNQGIRFYRADIRGEIANDSNGLVAVKGNPAETEKSFVQVQGMLGSIGVKSRLPAAYLNAPQ